MNLPETIKAKEAEKRWGCCRKILNKAVAENKMKAYKPGAAILYDVESGDKWWLSTQIKPVKRGRPRKH